MKDKRKTGKNLLCVIQVEEPTNERKIRFLAEFALN